MNPKKKLSVNLIKKLEAVAIDFQGVYRVKQNPNYAYCFYDADESSDLYFAIISEKDASKEAYAVKISFKPFSSQNPNAITKDVNLETLSVYFKGWMENIKFYHQPSVIDDAILESYKQEFFHDFKIIDNDADSKPFSYDQQISIVTFLDNVISNIDTVKDEKNAELIEEIKTETEILKSEVTTETQNGFMRKFSVVFAKARKGGIKVSDFILNELGKVIVRESFGFAYKHADKIPEYINHALEILKRLPS